MADRLSKQASGEPFKMLDGDPFEWLEGGPFEPLEPDEGDC